MLVKERRDIYNGELLDLRNDYVFKSFFGDKRNTNLLLTFLNSILKMDIHSIELTDPHIESNHPDDKKSIMDIRVETKQGEQINIEMQMEGHRAFTERMYMYMAKMYVSQDKVAKNYIEYKRAVQIIITNFNLLKEDEFHNVYKITNQQSGSIFTSHFETHVLELPKLKTKNIMKTTELEKLATWNQLLQPRARELAGLAITGPTALERNRGKIVDIGIEAWQMGGASCMRHLHAMAVEVSRKESGDTKSIDLIVPCWDGIGNW